MNLDTNAEVDDAYCSNTKPAESRECNVIDCPQGNVMIGDFINAKLGSSREFCK